MNISRDVIVSVVLLLICAFLWSITLTFETDPFGAIASMPATEMPRLVLSVIAFLSVILFFQGLRKSNQQSFGKVHWRTFATGGVMLMSGILFSRLGLPIVFFLDCLILPILWGSRRYLSILIYAICVPVAIYVVFQIILSVRMPLGPLASLGF